MISTVTLICAARKTYLCANLRRMFIVLSYETIVTTYICDLGFAQFCRNKTKCINILNYYKAYLAICNTHFWKFYLLEHLYFKWLWCITVINLNLQIGKNVFTHWGSIRDFCFGKYVSALPTMFHTVDLSSCPASFLIHSNNILAGFEASSYKYNSNKNKLLLLNRMEWFLPLLMLLTEAAILLLLRVTLISDV